MITLREANLEDLPLLLDFEAALIAYEREFTPSLKKTSFHYYDLKAYISDPSISVVVAEHNTQLIGSGYGLIKENKAYKNPEFYVFLGFMYVIPEYRGKGVNRKIVDYLLDWGKRKGYNEFQLDVYAQNDSAIKAYNKAGFSFDTLTMRMNLSD